jgi:hypothetical protein
MAAVWQAASPADFLDRKMPSALMTRQAALDAIRTSMDDQ